MHNSFIYKDLSDIDLQILYTSSTSHVQAPLKSLIGLGLEQILYAISSISVNSE